MKLVIDVFSAVIEIIYVLTFISIYSKGKLITGAKAVVFLLTCAALNVVIATFVQSQFLFSALNIILILAYSFIYKIELGRRILCSVIVYLMSVIGEIISGLLVTALLKISIDQMQSNLIVYLQVTMISKISIFAVIRIFKHFIKSKDAKISNLAILPFILLPVSSFTVLFVISDYVIQINTAKSKVLALLVSLLLLVSNMVVFFIFDYILKEKEKQNKIENEAM